MSHVGHCTTARLASVRWLAPLAALLVALTVASPAAARTVTHTFDSTRSEQSFVVPDDVSSVDVVATGSAGAGGWSAYAAGGPPRWSTGSTLRPPHAPRGDPTEYREDNGQPATPALA